MQKDVDEADEVEILYGFIRRYWGNGYATESAKKVYEWGKDLKIDRFISIIDPGNIGSAKVAEKVGMTFEKEAKVAHKCHLCNNDPECVKACPAGALRYIPWEDRTKDIPVRYAIPAAIKVPDDIKCQTADCHPDFEGSDNLASSIQ